MTPEPRDYDLCARAAREYRETPATADGIHFSCFNFAEAQMLRRLMERLYPGVPCYFTWLHAAPRPPEGTPGAVIE